MSATIPTTKSLFEPSWAAGAAPRTITTALGTPAGKFFAVGPEHFLISMARSWVRRIAMGAYAEGLAPAELDGPIHPFNSPHDPRPSDSHARPHQRSLIYHVQFSTGNARLVSDVYL